MRHERFVVIYGVGDYLCRNYPVQDGYIGSYVRRTVGTIRGQLIHNVWEGDYCTIA